VAEKWEVWVKTKKGSARYASCDSFSDAQAVIADEKRKLWLRLPEFKIKRPDGNWQHD
jgi:hypothetical protein